MSFKEGQKVMKCPECEGTGQVRRDLIPLTRHGERVAFARIDPEDYERLSIRRWSIDAKGYARSAERVDGKIKTIWLHREVLGCEVGDGLVVDHIDHDPLNCTKANLRIVTLAENNLNRPNDPESGYQNVYRHRDHWRALIQVDGEKHHLGCFDDVGDAADAVAEFRDQVSA